MIDTLSLYVHWPYCTRICPYCDFNIYKNKTGIQEALVAAILLDMRYGREHYGPRHLSSIHFGGGTPSLLSPKNLGRVLDLAVELWSPVPDIEIGLEANPKDISNSSLKNWRSVGVERLSIGVQSFDDRALKFLGRDHGGASALEALNLAVDILPRVSADLIYGWQGQSLDGWKVDLNTAIDTGVSHISAYQLTIENNTAFGLAQMRGLRKDVCEEQSADFYELGLDILSRAGFDGYEVSNFAKSNAARSRHNLAYWQGADYMGVGPGAHGRITTGGERTATICAAKPRDYIDHVKQQGHGMKSQEILSPESWGQEYLLMGLRISEGISLRRFREISGNSISLRTIKTYVQAGLLRLKNDRLAATPKGRLVLDSLSHELWLG